MSFPTLDRLVILTAEHVYSGRPGDRFRVHGLLRSEITQQTCYLLLIQCLTGATETCFTLLTIFAGKSCGQNNSSFGDYAVRRPFLGKVPVGPLERFVPSSVYMTHPTPLPAWCECRVWLGRCSACALQQLFIWAPTLFRRPLHTYFCLDIYPERLAIASIEV